MTLHNVQLKNSRSLPSVWICPNRPIHTGPKNILSRIVLRIRGKLSAHSALCSLHNLARGEVKTHTLRKVKSYKVGVVGSQSQIFKKWHSDYRCKPQLLPAICSKLLRIYFKAAFLNLGPCGPYGRPQGSPWGCRWKLCQWDPWHKTREQPGQGATGGKQGQNRDKVK